MNTYIAVFVISLFSSLALTPTIRRFSLRLRLFDEPDHIRRIHSKHLPRLGGLAILPSVIAGFLILPMIHNDATHALAHEKWHLASILAPATVVLLLGVYDDICEASPYFKLSALLCAGVIFCAMGGRIDAITLPLLGSFYLPLSLSYLVTIVWVVGVANAFNLIDGIDGLAAGAGLFASVVILIVSLTLNHPQITMLAIALCGALIGFLRYNFNPASIFLGDSGSLLIGFSLAAMSVQGMQKASTAVAVAIPLIAFALPVIDTTFSVVRRFLSGKPIFEGDREHIHHMLLARGWSQRRVVFVLYAMCAAMGLISLLFINEAGRLTGLILIVVGSAIVLALGRLRYHEVDEIKASMRRNLTERRSRAINHLAVRRASRAVSDANSLTQLFNAMRLLLEIGEFVHADVQVGTAASSVNNERLFFQEDGLRTLSGIDLRDGIIHWSWSRAESEGAEIIESHHLWSLRLPIVTHDSVWGCVNLYREFEATALLLDINYICYLFQREMANAAERIFTASQRENLNRVRDSQSFAVTRERALETTSLVQAKLAKSAGQS